MMWAVEEVPMDRVERSRREAMRLYDRLSRWYDMVEGRWEAPARREGLRLLKAAPGERVLEVGVGTGRFASRLGVKVGVEPAKAMADMARKRGIEVYEARAEELPFDDESFDTPL